MKTYIVGGAVRDRLLGLPVSDRDHVVVGATVDEMLAAGFKPVGRDFPVFLHPVTHEEYALARTERKVAPGYAGFVFHADPTVTLEADLARRDLTINAMAQDDAATAVIDPFGGQSDLALRLFRHVGPAFVEDPVRLLRVARFAARFADFTIAPETLALMRRMTDAGEIDALVPERVWQEISRGLMERTPVRMLAVLEDSGAFARLLPELAAAFAADPVRRPATLAALACAVETDSAVDVRFAVLVQFVEPSSIETLCTRFAVPKAVRELASIVARERDAMIADAGSQASASAHLRVAEGMERSDAFRRAPRFVQAVAAIACSFEDRQKRSRFVGRMRHALDAASAVDAGRIVREAGNDPTTIAAGLRSARRAAIVASLDDPEAPR